MKRISLVIFVLSMISSAAFAANKAANAMVVVPQDIKWTEVPGFPGVSTSTIEGDATKGAHHAFMKFAPGFSAPLHHHTADHFVTVVSGTLILTVDGKEHRLPPGSYFSFKKKQ